MNSLKSILGNLKRHMTISITAGICVVIAAIIICGIFSIDGLKDSKTTLNESVNSLTKDNEKLQKENDLLKKELEQIKQQLESVKAEKDTLQKQFDDIQQQLSNIGSEKDKQEKIKGTNGMNFILSNSKSGEKTAYLTFDDGPSIHTEKILEILKENDIKATFFVNGHGSPQQYKKILDDGHTIGNHSYSHDYKTVYSSIEGFKEDFNKLNNLLESIAGYKMTVFRFPGGSTNTVYKKYGSPTIIDDIKEVLKDNGFVYFDWNVSSVDADISGKMTPKDAIVKNVLNGAKGKKAAIILMHDEAAKSSTVEALPEIISGLKEQGFKFGVLSK